jgi:3-oxoadipate CoA-transferase alpha subunit
MPINKLVPSFDEAVADIFDGAVILLGGFGPANGTPSYLIRAVARKGVKNLTIVANTPGWGRQPVDDARPHKQPPNYDDGGLLIQNGQVRKVVCCFPATLGGRRNAVVEQYNAGKLEVEIVPQGTLAERIRAAKAGIGAFYTPTGAGSDTVVDRGKETRLIDGRLHVLEYAFRADFALIRAYRADRYGNLVYQGTSRNFNGAMAGAAKVTIAEVDEMVQLGNLVPENVATPALYVDRVASRKDSREVV